MLITRIRRVKDHSIEKLDLKLIVLKSLFDAMRFMRVDIMTIMIRRRCRRQKIDFIYLHN